MRLAHKRSVQMKLKKFVKASSSKTQSSQAKSPPVSSPKKKSAGTAKSTTNNTPSSTEVSLTPKQEQILSIIKGAPTGINAKSIGLEAGQDDAKASSWASGGVKKLVDEGLVVKETLDGNKVQYKAT
ncbi:MarR family transcriptional regulator [Vibrio sp.]|nr:MarR family transcriptional regulator [Vibrio sp.]